MLSVLIPIYQQDIRTLVSDLLVQCQLVSVPFEIICVDDGSQLAYRAKNRELKTHPKVRYHELATNRGRSAIRNHLASIAKYDYLLFMDGDSGVVREDYIAQYLAHKDQAEILYGGTYYAETAPTDTQYILHWKYGRAREQLSVERRQRQPYLTFKTNNFLIHGHAFQSIGFDESITQYGYEDTLFALEARVQNYRMLHLDNPMQHLGLEPTPIFLRKQQQAIQTLWQLYRNNRTIETKLLQLYLRLRRWQLVPLTRWILRPMSPFLVKHLLTDDPNLFALDLYKLQALLSMSHKTQL